MEPIIPFEQDREEFAVLILAYDFPPFVSVGGLRPYSWLRHFREFGAEPVVVTRQWENRYGDERDYVAPSATTREEIETSSYGTLIRAPHAPHPGNKLYLRYGPNGFRLIRRAITTAFEIGQFYAPVGPRAALYRAARRVLATRRIDVILATGEPFVLFNYAGRLSHEFGIPWVADFRDPWSQYKLRARHPLLRIVVERLERRTTASAAAITTVSESVAGTLSRLHKSVPIQVVRNGFDPDAADAARRIPQGVGRFTIAFAGTLYPYHPIDSVLQVLEQIARSGARVGLKFIGINHRMAFEALVREKYPRLAETTTILDRLPNEQALIELAMANALLLFNEYAHMGTKVFNYLAVRRRILLCYSDDPGARTLKAEHYSFDPGGHTEDSSLERLIRDTQSGVVLEDSVHLARVVLDLLREFDERGEISCNSVGIEQYSRQTQAANMVRVLKGIRGAMAGRRAVA